MQKWHPLRLAGLLGIFFLFMDVCPQAEAQSKSYPLFRVRTNRNKNKSYQFYAVVKGKEQRLVAVRYLRKTRKRVTGPQGLTRMRWVVDPCYPVRLPFSQLARGLPLLRARKPISMPQALQRILATKASGAVLPSTQKRVLRRQMRSFCRRFKQNDKGRFVNSIRGYGFKPGVRFDPIRGGYIVVTYLNNGLLNFFRGKYRYVVLKLTRRKARGGRLGAWKLMTVDGKDASKLFFRVYSLGISRIELDTVAGGRPVPSRLCAKWIETRAGTCRLSHSSVF